MVFSKTVLHGIYTLCHLDQNRKVPATPSVQISAALGIPLQHSAKILQRLCHVKLIESVRGRRGGYRLNLELTEITLLEVLDALNPSKNEERLRPRSCRNDPAPMCDAHRELVKLQQRVRTSLAGVTLGGMTRSRGGMARSMGNDLPEESLVRMEDIGGVFSPVSVG